MRHIVQIFGAQKPVFGAQKPVLGAQNLVFELPNPRDGLSFLAGAFFSVKKTVFGQKTRFWSKKNEKKKSRLRGRDPHSEIRSEILRRGAVTKSKMAGWRPSW